MIDDLIECYADLVAIRDCYEEELEAIDYDFLCSIVNNLRTMIICKLKEEEL